MNKTKEDAAVFAETLEPGEAEIFAKWFDAGEFDKIRGHFPAFENCPDAPANEAPTKEETV